MNAIAFPLRSAFLALPLADDAQRSFAVAVSSLTLLEDCVTFQPALTAHLTLVFWKELLKIEYDDIVRQAKTIAQQTESFSLQVTGADTFAARGRDSILYFTVAFSPELATLKKRCPWPQQHPFHPHITIARIKHPERFATKKKRAMKELKNTAFAMNVNMLQLYGQVDGRKQTPLRSFPFMIHDS